MKKVLVVDDNPANVKLTAEALKYAGYEVLEADNGQDAINISEKEKPDLILLDIQMPGMDGLATIWKIRSLPGMENLPVVAITAYAMKGDREKYLKEGFSDYIAKPMRIKTLIDTVGGILEK